MKLKYKLIKLERALVFQVLEQSELVEPGGNLYRCSNGVLVGSVRSPELSGSSIFLRGDFKASDLKAAARDFESNAERDDYAARLHAALKEWADNAPCFHGSTKASEPDTYEL